MNIPAALSLGLSLLLGASGQTLLAKAPSKTPYEAPPTLNAKAILRPEYLSGPHHQVRTSVPTYAGNNHFVIDSDFGVFEADGNTELATRIQEIYAINKLSELSRTDEYKEALKKAAQSPLKVAQDLVSNPVKTVTGVPKGIWKFMNRAGQSIKEVGQQRERSPYEDSMGRDLIGFSKAKRAIALQLGVDPYSSNEALQKELNSVSWASFAGSMTVTLALAPVGGGAGAALSGLSVAKTTNDVLREQSPSDLRRLGADQLSGMGVTDASATNFLNNNAYSPTNQTLLIAALAQLRGVNGREDIVRLATIASDEADAVFFRRCVQLMARVHGEIPLSSVGTDGSLPFCLAQDGTLVVPLEWDYAALTQRADDYIKFLKSATWGSQPITGYHLVLTGVASPRLKAKLASEGIRLSEKALPGPLQ